MGFLFRLLINCFHFLHICSLFSKLFIFFSNTANFVPGLFSLFRYSFLLIRKRSIFISLFTWELSYSLKITFSHTWLSPFAECIIGGKGYSTYPPTSKTITCPSPWSISSTTTLIHLYLPYPYLLSYPFFLPHLSHPLPSILIIPKSI